MSRSDFTANAGLALARDLRADEAAQRNAAHDARIARQRAAIASAAVTIARMRTRDRCAALAGFGLSLIGALCAVVILVNA